VCSSEEKFSDASAGKLEHEAKVDFCCISVLPDGAKSDNFWNMVVFAKKSAI
jgi:hypothetical protein